MLEQKRGVKPTWTPKHHPTCRKSAP